MALDPLTSKLIAKAVISQITVEEALIDNIVNDFNKINK